MRQVAGNKMFQETGFFELLKLLQNLFSNRYTEFWRVTQDCDLLISSAATTLLVDLLAEKLCIPIEE